MSTVPEIQGKMRPKGTDLLLGPFTRLLRDTQRFSTSIVSMLYLPTSLRAKKIAL